MNSWAYTITPDPLVPDVFIDVGDLDTIIDTTTLLNSGDAEEQAWVESVLGFSVTFDTKNDGSFDWILADFETDIYVQELSSDPEYYLIKLGGGSFAGDTHVLYDNAIDLSYAVIDLGILGQGATIDITRVSHISEFDGTISVPEPGTLALFGLGLLGLVVSRRRKV